MPAARPTTINPADRLRWAREIAALKLDGRSWAEIKTHTGLPVRTCQRIHAQHMSSGDPDSPYDPEQLIRRHIDALEIVLQEAGATYASTDHDGTKVGALRLFMEASEAWLDVMRRAGFLPLQMNAMNVERELREMLRRFTEVLRDHGASDEMLQAVLEIANTTVVGRPEQPKLTG